LNDQIDEDWVNDKGSPPLATKNV